MKFCNEKNNALYHQGLVVLNTLKTKGQISLEESSFYDYYPKPGALIITSFYYFFRVGDDGSRRICNSSLRVGFSHIVFCSFLRLVLVFTFNALYSQNCVCAPDRRVRRQRLQSQELITSVRGCVYRYCMCFIHSFLRFSETDHH